MKYTVALLYAALSFAAQPAVGQVVIGGGAGVVYGGYGLYPYGLYAPYAIVDPWATVPSMPRIPDAAPSCYRLAVLACGGGRVPVPGGAARSACARRTAWNGDARSVPPAGAASRPSGGHPPRIP
jgi:hypothetical protein